MTYQRGQIGHLGTFNKVPDRLAGLTRQGAHEEVQR